PVPGYSRCTAPIATGLERPAGHHQLSGVQAADGCTVGCPADPGGHCPHIASNGGCAMRQFDLSPLYRSTVGFDRLFSMLDQVAGVDSSPSYPPYNIERTGEDAYRITVAVAGFASDDH